MDRGSFDSINWWEFGASVLASMGVGMIRFLILIRNGRKVRWVDAVLEPSIAVFAGMLMWAGCEVTGVPDVLQAIFTSLGAWGGPRTLHKLERKYMGGSRTTDFSTLDEK